MNAVPARDPRELFRRLNQVAGRAKWNLPAISEKTQRRWIEFGDPIPGPSANNVALKLWELSEHSKQIKRSEILRVVASIVPDSPTAWPSSEAFAAWVQDFVENKARNGAAKESTSARYPRRMENPDERESLRDAPIADRKSALKHVSSWPPAFAIELPPRDFQKRSEFQDILSTHEKPTRTAQDIRFGFYGQRGAGKKTLARAFAHEVKALFPDGGMEISMCDPNGQPIAVRVLLAEIIDYFRPENSPLPLEEAQLASKLRETLRGRNALLLLKDGASASQLFSLLQYALAAGCGILFTARANLPPRTVRDLRFTQVHVPLSAPTESLALALEIAGRKKAFEQTGRLFCKTFQNQLWAVREAAESLTEDIAGALADLRGELVTEPLTLLHSSRAKFEARYRQMTPVLQKAWQFLAVFKGQFTADAAEIILKGERTSSKTSREKLNQLCKLGLVDFCAGNGQFEIFPQDRIFLERMLSRDERSVVAGRHANFISEFSEKFPANEYKEDWRRAILWSLRNKPKLGVSLFCRGFVELEGPTAVVCALRVARLSDNPNELLSAGCAIFQARTSPAFLARSPEVRAELLKAVTAIEERRREALERKYPGKDFSRKTDFSADSNLGQIGP